MWRSPSDLNLGRSSSFSRLLSGTSFRRLLSGTSFRRDLEEVSLTTIGMTTPFLSLLTTLSLSVSTLFRGLDAALTFSGGGLQDSELSFVSRTFWFSATTRISSSFSFEWLMVIVFFENFFCWTGLDVADAELVLLPRENRPLSAKFWTVDCVGSMPRILETFWKKIRDYFGSNFYKIGLKKSGKQFFVTRQWLQPDKGLPAPAKTFEPVPPAIIAPKRFPIQEL